MFYVLWFIALVISYVVGVFGFCQIIGSIQTRQRAFLLTILFNAAVLVLVYFGIRRFLSEQITALYIGYIISLIQSLSAGRIR